MTVRYQIWLTDGNTGAFTLQIPMRLSQPYTRRLNGTGTLSGTVPMDAPGLSSIPVTERYEITVMRDDGSGFLPDWNGPITTMNIDPINRVYEITAQEISGIFAKRTIEVDKDYSGWDRYDIVRDIITTITTKTSTAGDGMSTGPGSNINAAIPRLSVSPATADSGFTLDAGAVPAAPRYLASDVLDKIIGDDENPFDWKMDYKTGSTSTSVHRTLTLGAPLGTTLSAAITNSDVLAVTKEMDRFRSANRVHTVGAGTTTTLQNESDITVNNDVLLESVFERSDLSDTGDILQFTKAARSASFPPITTHTFTFTPGWGSFGFGFCDVGDNININLSGASLTSIGHRRVTQIGVLPATPDNPELFVVDISIKLDVLS